MEPLPGVFDTLKYFETILPLVESFWSSKQDEVYFMGGGAAGGLWRHQQWLPSWIFLRFFEQHLPRNDRPLMRSSDVTTTRKSGSDFDWLIV